MKKFLSLILTIIFVFTSAVSFAVTVSAEEGAPALDLRPNPDGDALFDATGCTVEVDGNGTAIVTLTSYSAVVSMVYKSGTTIYSEAYVNIADANYVRFFYEGTGKSMTVDIHAHYDRGNKDNADLYLSGMNGSPTYFETHGDTYGVWDMYSYLSAKSGYLPADNIIKFSDITYTISGRPDDVFYIYYFDVAEDFEEDFGEVAPDDPFINVDESEEEQSEDESEEEPSEVVIDWDPAGENDLPIMLVNDESFEGTTVIHTCGVFGSAWRDAVLLEETEEDTYKVVEKYASSGTAPNVVIEEGYILIAANVGNNWPSLFASANGTEWFYSQNNGHGIAYADCPNFATSFSTQNDNFINSMKVGEEYKLVGFINDTAYCSQTFDENYYYATDYENCKFFTYLTKIEAPEESSEEKSEPAETSKEESKTEEKSKEESKSEEKSADKSKPAEESKAVEKSNAVEESKITEEEKSSPVIWIVIGAVAVMAIAVVIVIIVKKKK